MRHRLLRSAIGLGGASLLAGASIAVPAAASTTKLHNITQCGQVIASSGQWALASDLTCPVTDTSDALLFGIRVKVNSVTLNLNNHAITGGDTTNASNVQQIGVLLTNVHGVTVIGPGTITGFDAGVAVLGGGGNTVTGVTAHDNIAHVLLTGGVGGTGDPATNACDYGDGIMTDNSSGNSVTNNTSYHNGPYSGIALVDASTGNTVSGNNTHDQTVSNILAAGTPGAGLSGPCGPFGANIVGRGRPHQDTGIRIEGPGATNNVVTSNTSTGNQLEGIAIHSHICDSSPSQTPPGPPPTPDNAYNTVSSNTVTGNGFADVTDGIAILHQGPTGTVCPSSHETITGNTSTGNAHDGIFMGGRGSSNNTVTNNILNTNGHDGIELGGPETDSNGVPVPGSIDNTISANSAHGNPNFDAEDHNPTCDSNSWSGDSFGTVNQTCVM